MADLTVLEFVTEIERCADADTAWREFVKFVNLFGFTHGGLADMPGPSERLEDTILCLSWPEEWSQRYFAQKYIHDDPARVHLARTNLPYTWHDLLSCSDYDRKQKTIVHEASEFGLTNGYIIPLANIRGGPAMITIAGSKVILDRLTTTQIHLAALYTHAKIRALVAPQLRLQPALSHRERECLQWAADGKSDWEIGHILGISEKTASTHIQRVKMKYGVGTRLQAVISGLRSGFVRT